MRVAQDGSQSEDAIVKLNDWASIASLLALIGIVPVLYNAALQLNDRRKAQHGKVIRAGNRRDWHIIRPVHDQRMVRVEDVMACHVVYSKLTSMGYRVTMGNDDSSHPANVNLVLVCGPRVNKVSAAIAEYAHLPIEYIAEDGGAFYDSRTHQKYASGIDQKHPSDIAMFGRVRDRAGNNCYLLWGLHCSGTVGAARAFVDDEFLDRTYEITKGHAFVGVVHVGFTSLDDMGAVSWLASPALLPES
jgi:hypothetical protein